MSDASHSEELLSAYADGQLTGADKVRAEKLIADNPHYAELIEQWREQGQMIRALPRFRMDRDFSDRILVTHDLERTDLLPQRSSIQSERSLKLWDGRTAAAAILALAAMILLTLFVFPAAPQPMSEVAVSSPSKNQSPDVSTNEEASESDSVSIGAEADDRALKSGDLADRLQKKSLDDEELARTKSKDVFSEPKLPEQPKFAILPSNLAEGGESKSQADKDAGGGGFADEQRSEKEENGQALAMVEQIPLPVAPIISPVETPFPVEIVEVNPVRNVDEVWFVDMLGKRPIEKLRQALVKNQIQFETSQIENDLAGQSADSIKMEAIHVIASKSQIHGAIALLTNEADVLSYSIPSFQELESLASAAGRMNSVSADGNRILEKSASSSFSTFAQHLRQERNLPMSLDYSSKMRSLPYFGTVLSGESQDSKNDQNPAAGSNLALDEKDPTRADSRPLAAKAQPSEGGLAMRSRAAKQLEKLNKGDLEQAEKEVEQPADDDAWYKIRDEQPKQVAPGAKADPDPSRQLIAKEQMKRFLLLIRFDQETEAAETSAAEVAPAGAGDDDQ